MTYARRIAALALAVLLTAAALGYAAPDTLRVTHESLEQPVEKLNVDPLPRGGNSCTLNNSGGGNNQTSGPSLRIIADTENWDDAVGMNSPGQSGDPDSYFYDNLFELWANDKFFPVFFSREKIESVARDVIFMNAP